MTTTPRPSAADAPDGRTDDARDASRVLTTRADLRAATDAWTVAHPGERRAVVMTMGALHAGHLELVRRARAEVGPGGQVVVTDFVNPLQFGPGEDYERYPRDVAADVALLAAAGADVAVDLVFAPAVEELYPDLGPAAGGTGPIVRVTSGRIGTVLEGASRPGHFDGVLTVVLKLLHLVRPDVAVFGAKDAQQLLAVRRLVADLDLDVEIVGVPTVREADGLARSSRNAYLSPAERDRALALSRALRAGSDTAASGADAAAVLAAARGILDGADGVEVDYVALVDPATVEDLAPGAVGPGLLLVAARVGTTRLIDNAAVEIAPPATRAADPAGRAPAPGGTA
ncbi:pantoate--beta-alanine ligase [Cellulosimicrobium cellulans]|jgi:pantoate--beta-alanine ligase|uniref:Pantothenate synthetase n=1 Tax=Cellulosimicrobium cellulans TaxID=1710 RepID=A0A1Y0HRQ1_CELCE|nr:pantoate--beta-alanine ligase [Cellulosimicrobium cellulans]ARU50791.1 pantoate--beta-alanine ligase [Cellulosimicrobium cellulans]